MMNHLKRAGSALALAFGLAAMPSAGTAFPDAPPPQSSPTYSMNDFSALPLNTVLHVPTGRVVEPSSMLDTISSARVIYIGEQHDNMAAHMVQRGIIRAMEGRYPGQVVVGMEMFRRSAAEKLRQWHAGDLDDSGFRDLFRENWDDGYGAYADIFNDLQERGIPLIGLKPTTETEARVRGGEMPVPGNGLPEMDMDAPHYRDYYMQFFGGHPVGEAQTDRFYRMMVLWDEAMAESVAEFLADPQNHDRKLIVLAGEMHVRYGFGIPDRAARRVAHDYAIVLPDVGARGLPPPPLRAGDFIWRVPYLPFAPQPVSVQPAPVR